MSSRSVVVVKPILPPEAQCQPSERVVAAQPQVSMSYELGGSTRV